MDAGRLPAPRVALHRDEIRAETNKLDWLFSTHTTSRSAAELLLFLHSGMMVSKGAVRSESLRPTGQRGQRNAMRSGERRVVRRWRIAAAGPSSSWMDRGGGDCRLHF